ncbi:MAG: hypothetical protein Q9162_004347 [Coniocarpon cinnabarinum]
MVVHPQDEQELGMSDADVHVEETAQELENMTLTGSEPRALPECRQGAIKPLTFWLPLDHTPGQYWTHEPYQNAAGETVSVIYCQDHITSERVAKPFLRCPVVGFDMEWAPFGAKGIKGNISVIQVACEDKIAIFHIALHHGRTVSELLCPSLRKLIEDENILKCGVAINNADGNRLRRWMKLQPRGMFELSHMHKVVKWAKRDPKMVNKRLIKLTWLAEEHLGRPLFKGNVRTSDWTKPLNEEQIRYAAADAYSGFRIFHALEAKRAKMDEPVPPRPAPAELGMPLLLTIAVNEDDEERASDLANESGRRLPMLRGSGDQNAPLLDGSSNTPSFQMPSIDFLACGDRDTRQIYSALRAVRRRLSLHMGNSEESLATDSTLFSLAETRPTCDTKLDCRAQRWADVMLKEGRVDLFAFLRKYTPSDEQGPSLQECAVEQPEANTMLSSSPDTSTALQTSFHADGAESVLGKEDYSKYFSEDDFDDTGLSSDSGG